MWGQVLGWALVTSINPLLLGFILVVISRPRPVPNMLLFWTGCLIVNVPAFLVPLALLHLNPAFTSFAERLTSPTKAGGSTIEPFPLVTGVLALAIAAVLALRLVPRKAAAAAEETPRRRQGRRHRGRTESTQPSTPVSASPVLVLDTAAPIARPGVLGRVKTSALRLGAAIRRLPAGAQNSWENGSVWVSFVAGLGYFPPPPLVLIVGLAIAGSGAAIGTQFSAAIIFVVAMLWLVELILVSCLIVPAKTQKVLGPVNDWMQAHRRQVLITLFALVGVWQVAAGLGIA